MRAASVARKEYADAIRSRTLWAIVVLVAGVTSLGVAVTAIVPGGTGPLTAIGGAAQLSGVLVPILALVAAYLSIAGERESGSIKVLLGLPPTRGSVLLGKAVGRGLVVVTGILIGYLVAGFVLVLAFGTVSFGPFVGVTLLSAALGVVFVGIAVGISASTATRARAMTYSVAVYLGLTVFWDLVPRIVMLLVDGGASPVGRVPPWYLFVRAFSPTGAFNALVADVLGGAAGSGGFTAVLGGPAPFYLTPWAMGLLLVGWTVVPVALGYRAFAGADIS